MYVGVYVCMYVFVYVCMYVCMYVGVYVCMYVGVYVCMYVCLRTTSAELDIYFSTLSDMVCSNLKVGD